MQSDLETAELCLFPAKKVIGEQKCDFGQCFDCSSEFWNSEQAAEAKQDGIEEGKHFLSY